MKYLVALLIAVGLLLVTPPAASAGHRHFGHHHHHHHHGHFGHHHHWGHRHFGGWGAYRHWGGYGYRPWGGVSISVGWGGYPYGYGWGGYRPYYGYGGYLHSALYRPYIYSSYYRPYWSYQYDYLQPYYYYQAPVYYGYPAYGYFGSTPSVNINRVIIVKRDDSRPAAAAEPKTAILKTVVAKTRVDLLSRSRQLMKLGDEAFREGRYQTALTRYRTAAETAPSEPEPHFRKGHAYLAIGKYDLASASFRKALSIEPSAHRDGFQLDDLYGRGSVAKGVHLENLAALALMHEEAPEGYFLLGLMLHFNGESSRAEKFFARAAMLSRDTREAVAGFLPERESETPVSVATTDEI